MNLLQEFQKTSRHFYRHHTPHDDQSPVVKVKGINVVYESGYALEDVTFELGKGVHLAVVGPNGAGKSTLFKVIAGVLVPASGEVNVYGHEPGGHICIAYVPQRSQVDWNFPVSVSDVVLMGRVGQMGLFRNPSSEDHEFVRQALDIVGMTEFAGRQISQLSGGQQQRMFIARALAQQAELMLMDEPLTGLDVNSQEDIFNILSELKSRRVTVLLSLHDLQLASQRFEQVMLLNHKIMGIGSPAEVLSPENLLEAYAGKVQLVQVNSGFVALGDTCCDGEEHNHV